MAIGIDVSYNQGKPDWKKVKESGKVDFVYVRASVGLSSKSLDSSFSYNWTNLKAESILRGAYHFFFAESDPVKQAENFFWIVGELEDNDLPPMIDVEVERPRTMSPQQFAKNVRAFIERAEELFKRRIVVYTGGPIFFQETHGADESDIDFISDRELWLSAYVIKPDIYVPTAWKNKGKSWVIWQDSGNKDAKGNPGWRVPGINTVVDHNITQGSASDLLAWIESSKIQIIPKNLLSPQSQNNQSDLIVLQDQQETPIVQNNPISPQNQIIPKNQSSFSIIDMISTIIQFILSLFTYRK